MDELHRRLSGNLRAIAHRKGVPLDDIVARAGVARSHFYDVLAGRKSPTLTWIEKIATALDVDAVELLARRDTATVVDRSGSGR